MRINAAVAPPLIRSRPSVVVRSSIQMGVVHLDRPRRAEDVHAWLLVYGGAWARSRRYRRYASAVVESATAIMNVLIVFVAIIGDDVSAII
jgi:hypothetical protein